MNKAEALRAYIALVNIKHEHVRVAAACRGVVISNAQDEMDRLEFGFVVPPDPEPLIVGTSFLYHEGSMPKCTGSPVPGNGLGQ